MTTFSREDPSHKCLFSRHGAPVTLNQLRFIGTICKALKVPHPAIKTRLGATRWIKKHIHDYNAHCLEEQLENISPFLPWGNCE